MRREHRFLAGTLGLALLVLGFAAAESALARNARAGAGAEAAVVNTAGAGLGTATFVQKGDVVEIRVELAGLTPGFHGFHVHAVGTCDGSAAFTSAGGHFNPGAATHGHHAGDLPVLLADGGGIAVARVRTDRFRVSDLLDADGSALIVHAAPDNYANIPARYASSTGPGPDAATLATGDAGGRAGCGVIAAS